MSDTVKSVGIAGCGAIGSAVARALTEGIDGYKLTAITDTKTTNDFNVPNVSFEELAKQCDLIVEALPADIVPDLARTVLTQGKDLVLISSCALILYPEIEEWQQKSKGRILVPSGALMALDGVKGLKELNIKKSKIVSTKPPMSFGGAPYIIEHDIDVTNITTKTRIFEGNVLEAAKGFPANLNVGATLSLAGIGPHDTMVEIWADPKATGNSHAIEVVSEFSTLNASITTKPDPTNPKSSVLAAQSIVALLRGLSSPITVL